MNQKNSEANVSNLKYKTITVNETVERENKSESNDTDSKENIEKNESKKFRS